MLTGPNLCAKKIGVFNHFKRVLSVHFVILHLFVESREQFIFLGERGDLGGWGEFAKFVD